MTVNALVNVTVVSSFDWLALSRFILLADLAGASAGQPAGEKACSFQSRRNV